jgi:hypothetical protein
LWPDNQGNAYITGYTHGNIGGPNAGFVDGYLRKYDALGNIVWSRQLGSSANDELWRVRGTADGEIYIAGFTEGDLARPIVGNYDAILAKYDAEGNQRWIKQFGDMFHDSIRGLTTDPSGNIIVAGISGGPQTPDPAGLFAKFDSNGELIFTKDFGDRKVDQVHDVSTDEAGNIYLVEQTGDLSLAEYFVSKYDFIGNELWTRKLGENYNKFSINEIEADAAGNLYVVGATKLSLGRTNPSPDQFDAFVRKYDANGNVRWTYQFGTDGGDFGHNFALDGLGNIFLVGETDGSLAVANPTSSRDAWIALLREHLPGDYNSDGLVDAADYQVWRAAFGSASDLAADWNGDGIVDAADYVVWRNNSQLSNLTARSDAALVPEPASHILLGTILVLAGSRASRRRFS